MRSNGIPNHTLSIDKWGRRYWFVAVVVLLCGTACEGDPELDLVRVELELAIDFEGDDVLEVSVFEASVASCANIGPSTVDTTERVGRVQAAAADLNAGEVTLEFDDLPAEVPLTFYGRVVRGADEIVVRDCVNDVTIPEGGNVSVELVFSEP